MSHTLFIHQLMSIGAYLHFFGHYEEYYCYEHSHTSFVFISLHIFSFLWGKYLGVELLGTIVTLCAAFWRTAKLFFRVAAQFLHSHPGIRKSSDFSTFLLTTNLSLPTLVIICLVGVKCYLIVLRNPFCDNVYLALVFVQWISVKTLVFIVFLIRQL